MASTRHRPTAIRPEIVSDSLPVDVIKRRTSPEEAPEEAPKRIERSVDKIWQRRRFAGFLVRRSANVAGTTIQSIQSPWRRCESQCCWQSNGLTILAG